MVQGGRESTSPNSGIVAHMKGGVRQGILSVFSILFGHHVPTTNLSRRECHVHHLLAHSDKRGPRAFLGFSQGDGMLL